MLIVLSVLLVVVTIAFLVAMVAGHELASERDHWKDEFKRVSLGLAAAEKQLKEIHRLSKQPLPPPTTSELR